MQIPACSKRKMKVKIQALFLDLNFCQGQVFRPMFMIPVPHHRVHGFDSQLHILIALW